MNKKSITLIFIVSLLMTGCNISEPVVKCKKYYNITFEDGSTDMCGDIFSEHTVNLYNCMKNDRYSGFKNVIAQKVEVCNE